MSSIGSKKVILGDYPNIENNEWPMLIGCIPEETIIDAYNFFLRRCYKAVTVNDVVPLKQDYQPSCAWRVFYKIKNHPPAYVEPCTGPDDFVIPLSDDDDEDLKELFNHVTAMIIGMNVGQKSYLYDKEVIIVDYVPIRCECPGQDLNITAKVPFLRSSITEQFCNMKL